MQNDTKWGGIKGGQVMAQPKPLFARIEQRTESEDGVKQAAKPVVFLEGEKAKGTSSGRSLEKYHINYNFLHLHI